MASPYRTALACTPEHHSPPPTRHHPPPPADGVIDFRRFLTGLAVLNGRGVAGRRDALTLAFRILQEPPGTTADGREAPAVVRESTMRRVLRKVWPGMTAEAVHALLLQAGAASAAAAGGELAMSSGAFIEWALRPESAHYLPVFTHAIMGFEDELGMLGAAASASSGSSSAS